MTRLNDLKYITKKRGNDKMIPDYPIFKKIQLSSFYGKPVKLEPVKRRSLLILQWGKVRSIVLFTDTVENEVQIVDNQYLIDLEEMGIKVL